MLKLPEDLKDQITKYLSNLSAPAAIGADLMQIVISLQNLEKFEEPAAATEE